MFKFKKSLFHSYLPFPNFLGQVIHFYKSNYMYLIKINWKFLQSFSLVVTNWHVLKKTWPKQVPSKLSFKPKTSHLIVDFKIVIIVIKFDPSSFTYAILSLNLYWSLIEISQIVTTSFATKFGSIYNYKINLQLFWSLLQLWCNYWKLHPIGWMVFRFIFIHEYIDMSH